MASLSTGKYEGKSIEVPIRGEFAAYVLLGDGLAASGKWRSPPRHMLLLRGRGLLEYLADRLLARVLRFPKCHAC